MNVVRCINGHFFDGEAYSACPHCGEAAMTYEAVVAEKEEKKGFWNRIRKDKIVKEPTDIPIPPADPNVETWDGNTPTGVLGDEKTEETPTMPANNGGTLNFWGEIFQPESETSAAEDVAQDADVQTDAVDEDPAYPDWLIRPEVTEAELEVKHEEPEPEEPEEEPRQEENAESALRKAIKDASANDEGKTMSYFSAVDSSASAPAPAQSKSRPASEPVVGWLVCISGNHFGESFSIFTGQNSVGRSEENRIVVANDKKISRNKHALIVYEPKKRNFYLQPGDSTGLTYLNDDYIMESHKLAARDIIELGDSKFMFVPLCGETFSWEEHIAKGE